MEEQAIRVPCTSGRLDFSWGHGTEIQMLEVLNPEGGQGGSDPHLSNVLWNAPTSSHRALALSIAPKQAELHQSLQDEDVEGGADTVALEAALWGLLELLCIGTSRSEGYIAEASCNGRKDTTSPAQQQRQLAHAAEQAAQGARHCGLTERLAALLESGRPDEQGDYWCALLMCGVRTSMTISVPVMVIDALTLAHRPLRPSAACVRLTACYGHQCSDSGSTPTIVPGHAYDSPPTIVIDAEQRSSLLLAPREGHQRHASDSPPTIVIDAEQRSSLLLTAHEGHQRHASDSPPTIVIDAEQRSSLLLTAHEGHQHHASDSPPTIVIDAVTLDSHPAMVIDALTLTHCPPWSNKVLYGPASTDAKKKQCNAQACHVANAGLSWLLRTWNNVVRRPVMAHMRSWINAMCEPAMADAKLEQFNAQACHGCLMDCCPAAHDAMQHGGSAGMGDSSSGGMMLEVPGAAHAPPASILPQVCPGCLLAMACIDSFDLLNASIFELLDALYVVLRQMPRFRRAAYTYVPAAAAAGVCFRMDGVFDSHYVHVAVSMCKPAQGVRRPLCLGTGQQPPHSARKPVQLIIRFVWANSHHTVQAAWHMAQWRHHVSICQAAGGVHDGAVNGHVGRTSFGYLQHAGAHTGNHQEAAGGTHVREFDKKVGRITYGYPVVARLTARMRKIAIAGPSSHLFVGLSAVYAASCLLDVLRHWQLLGRHYVVLHTRAQYSVIPPQGVEQHYTGAQYNIMPPQAALALHLEAP
ncbi:hypothetical protein DUNSADRAFT_9794 [Dunaliella salina]|uniref:Uncharacterized protein n=1 Tax=Dunaliella salina TaxID=3046 RepID=A0ABQ7GGN7_DUNSA|nr:hypothetical protein DUNSADRAFT_9794 [Dunaliella salina]|eukprot:KAF5833770.1 hypothetical protein DUNSADRAFT_9794 [Dunaliella salina]